jgi:hypothetical protein
MRHLFIILACVFVAGCGAASAAFDPSYPDSSSGTVRDLLARLERPKGSPLVVAVSVREKKVLAFDLESGRVHFTKDFEAAQAPIVAGETIVLSDGSRVVGLARHDGSRSFELRLDGLHLVGASGQGASVVLTLSDESRATVVAFDGGRRKWTRNLDHGAGVPAFGGELIVIPWAHQNLSFLRVSDGVEVARTRALGTIVGHAELGPLGLIAGQSQIFLVDASLGDDPRVSVERRLGPPKIVLPGSPSLRADAYARPEPPSSARHRIRLDALPARGEKGLVPEAGFHYYAFHSAILGVKGEDIAWSLPLDGSVAGLAAVEGGVYVASTEGQILFVSAQQGDVLVRQQLPLAIDVATFANLAAPEAETQETRRAATSWQHLVDLARDRNAQLAPIAKLAVETLGRHDDAASTAELAAMCDDDSLAPLVRQAACEALGSRSIGRDGLIEVLSRHASFLDRTTSPPVGPLSRAAAKIGDRSLAPILVTHLHDPATRSADLADLARALGELGDDSSAEALRAFLVAYHAYREDEGLSDGLVAAALAFEKLRGARAEPFLESLRTDPFSDPALVRALAERARNP